MLSSVVIIQSLNLINSNLLAIYLLMRHLVVLITARLAFFRHMTARLFSLHNIFQKNIQ